MKLTSLEDKIVKKETGELQAEFDRASKIIKDAMAKYGENFGVVDEEDQDILVFNTLYRSGVDRLAGPYLKVEDMPQSFLDAVKEQALSNFMESIEQIKAISEEL